MCASSAHPRREQAPVHADDRRRERGGEGALPHAGRCGRDDDLGLVCPSARPGRTRPRCGAVQCATKTTGCSPARSRGSRTPACRGCTRFSPWRTRTARGEQHHRLRRRGGRRGPASVRGAQKARHQGQSHPRADLRTHPHPRGPSRGRGGWRPEACSPRSTTPASRSARRRWASARCPRPGRRLRPGAPTVRQGRRRLQGVQFLARRHGDGARGGPGSWSSRRRSPSAATPTCRSSARRRSATPPTSR